MANNSLENTPPWRRQDGWTRMRQDGFPKNYMSSGPNWGSLHGLMVDVMIGILIPFFRNNASSEKKRV